MKSAVSLFLIFTLFASAVFSSVDLCSSLGNTQQVQLTNFDQIDSIELNAQQTHSHNDSESSSEHCELHCTHHSLIINVYHSGVSSLENSLSNSIYILSFSQTFLDGLFRPPLV